MSTAFLAAEAHRELPAPPWVFGLTALVLFMILLAVLWSFRNTAAKFDPANAHPSDPRGHLGAGHGEDEIHQVESGEVYRAGDHVEGRRH